MLTCREVTELVTDYLERKLSFRDTMRFHMHVGMCRHCRAYLRQMKQTIALLGALPKDEAETAMAPEVREDLLRRFRTWKN